MTFHQHEVLCPRCDSNRFFRKERQGFLQTRLFPLIGFYPWECKVCRLSCMRLKRRQPLVSASRGVEVG